MSDPTPQEVWSARLLVMLNEQDGSPVDDSLRRLADTPVPGSPWPHQHQTEPAGFTTPNPRGYFLGDTRPLGARIRSALEVAAVIALIITVVVYLAVWSL